MSTIMKGVIGPTSQDLGQFVGQIMYGSVMDMFLFGRKNCRIVAFEEVGYLFVDSFPYAYRSIDINSVKLQRKAAAKSP